MPTRLIDGEAGWESDKLAACPQEFVPHYFMLLPLALANGSFQCNARDIARRVYGKTMPSMTQAQVEAILGHFMRAKLLFTWRTPDRKLWGYWTKIEGRLPPASFVRRGEYGMGAPVPIPELAAFLERPVADVRAELEGTAAMLSPGDRVGRTKVLPRRDKVRFRLGLGWQGSAAGGVLPAVSSSSPTAPPPKPRGEAEKEKKRKSEAAEKGPSAESGSFEAPEAVAGVYAAFEVKYREVTGRLPGGNPAKRERYEALCAEFGEQAVLKAVASWAVQRGGPAKLAKNDFAAWDFLNDGQARSEILGSRRQSAGAPSLDERLQKHRQADARTRDLLQRKPEEK
jgi:hypothetical protein